MRTMTQFQCEVNPENVDSLRGMILHDSFSVDVNGVLIRCMRVMNGILYISKHGHSGIHSTFVPFPVTVDKGD